MAGAALCEPRGADFVADTALCEPRGADFVAGAALCEPPCADFVAGAALCEPPCADFVAGAALCEPPCADFVVVNLHAQISWQVQYKMRFREIADARNAAFFYGTGGFEPGKSSSAERRLRDGFGSWSDHARIVPPLWLEFSLVSRSADFVAGAALREPACAGAALSELRGADFVAGAALCEPPCADFVAGAALCEPPRTDFVAGATLCEPPCADFVAGAALCEPPCADFVAGAIQNAFSRDSGRTKCCIFQ